MLYGQLRIQSIKVSVYLLIDPDGGSMLRTLPRVAAETISARLLLEKKRASQLTG
jgi:hypothetical protein